MPHQPANWTLQIHSSLVHQAGSLDAIIKSANSIGRDTTIALPDHRFNVNKFNSLCWQEILIRCSKGGPEITVTKATILYFIVFHEFCLDMRWGKSCIPTGSPTPPFLQDKLLHFTMGNRLRLRLRLLVSLSCQSWRGTATPTHTGDDQMKTWMKADLGLCCEGHGHRDWLQL